VNEHSIGQHYAPAPLSKSFGTQDFFFDSGIPVEIDPEGCGLLRRAGSGEARQLGGNGIFFDAG